VRIFWSADEGLVEWFSAQWNPNSDYLPDESFEAPDELFRRYRAARILYEHVLDELHDAINEWQKDPEHYELDADIHEALNNRYQP
jgi:hypothetical protein